MSAAATAAAAEAEEDEEQAAGPAAAVEEDSDDDDENTILGGRKRSSRGSPHNRLLYIFSSNKPDAVFRVFLLPVQPDWESTPKQKQLVQRQVEELHQMVRNRPAKTNNTYWRLTEKVLIVLQLMYEKGLCQPAKLPDNIAVKPQCAYLIDSEIACDILQLMLKGDDTVAQLHAMAADRSTADDDAAAAAAAEGDEDEADDAAAVEDEAAAAAAAGAAPEGDAELYSGDVGMSAAEVEDMAAAAAFQHDSYRVGERVIILADWLLGAQLVAPVPAAEGIIRAQHHVYIGDLTFYEVENVRIIDKDTFDRMAVWVATEEGDAVNESLQDAYKRKKYLVVPTINLKAAETQEGGPTLNLSKSKVKAMKKQELIDLCKRMGISTDSCKLKADYAAKLLAYMEQHPTRTTAPAGSAGAPAPDKARLTRFDLKNLLNAMTDLQRMQHMLLGTTDVIRNIRSGLRMRNFMAMFKRAAATAQRRSLLDRQAGSLAVRPTHQQFEHMSANWWRLSTVVGLRDRAMFLEQIQTAMRGGDIREVELADRFTYQYPTSPMVAVAVLTIKQNGKTNQNGQLDYQGVIRHRDPRMCAIAANGIYHMAMYTTLGVDFPDLLGEDNSWFLQAVFPNMNSGGKMNYEEHRSATRRQLDAVDIVGGKTTHLARQHGAQKIIDSGGSRDMAKRQCHWLKDDMDLSYLNGPDINAMALEADWQGKDQIMIYWGVLRPPEECIQLLFPKLHGYNILEVIKILIERNKNPKTRKHTPLGVAKYLLEAGIAALQALPIILADPAFGKHSIMDHPAVKHPAFKAYSEHQLQFWKRLTATSMLVTPSLGPVLTQYTPTGSISSSLVSPERINGMVQNATVTYVATTAAAHAEAMVTRLPGGKAFMLVSAEERDLLLRCRANGSLRAALDAAASSNVQADSLGRATAAAAAAASANTASVGAAAAPSAGSEAAAATGPDSTTDGGQLASSDVPAGAPAAGSSDAHAGAAAAGSSDAHAATAAAAGSSDAHTDTAAAAGSSDAHTDTAAAADGSSDAHADTAAGPSSSRGTCAAASAAGRSGAHAAAAAAAGNADAARAARRQEAGSAAPQPGAQPVSDATRQAPASLEDVVLSSGDDVVHAKLDLLTGLMLQTTQQMEHIQQLQQLQHGQQQQQQQQTRARSSTPEMDGWGGVTFSWASQQQQQDQDQGQEELGPQPTPQLVGGQQRQQPNRHQQPRPSSSSNSSLPPRPPGPQHVYEHFCLTASSVITVPRLWHLFEKGWAPDRHSSDYQYQALSQSQYKGQGEHAKKQRTQWDNMSQCYKLLQALSQQQGISTQQAADVVEVWRSGKPVAYVLPEAGTVTDKAADAEQAGSISIPNLLQNSKTGKLLGLDAVCKQARGLELVQQMKNPKRAAAGRLGAERSASAKRQRTQSEDGSNEAD